MDKSGCSCAGIIISTGTADRLRSRRQRVMRNMAWNRMRRENSEERTFGGEEGEDVLRGCTSLRRWHMLRCCSRKASVASMQLSIASSCCEKEAIVAVK